jgi:glycosyltransferase involved in cell wall biosynthesis
LLSPNLSAGGDGTQPLRIALYSGVVMERDAVSKSFLWKLRLLQRLRDQGCGVEVTGFTQGSDYDDPDIRPMPDIGTLLRDPRFNEADLHVFEYAMWYELFNALFLIDRPSLVIDHNTTPAELINDPIVEAACTRAIRERHNLHLASRIATVSEFTRDQLVALGLGDPPITVIHLPPNNADADHGRRDFADPSSGDVIRLLFVGRLVQAKGIAELLGAMDLLWERDPDLRLTLAGSVRFSQPEVVASIERALADHGADGRLTLVRDASDDAIARLYGASDVFVMPSHHEGYCVPVVEALRSGCFVIGSDAGNIPTVIGGLGSVFPTGDAAALARRITEIAARVRTSRATGSQLVLPTSSGELALPNWHDAVARHLRDYSLSNFETKFLQLVEELAPPGPGRPPGWLTGAVPTPGLALQTS